MFANGEQNKQRRVAEMDNKLFYYRRVKGMRQFDLARKLGCSEQIISHYETGRVKPSPKRAQKIAVILGVKVGDVFPEIFANEGA